MVKYLDFDEFVFIVEEDLLLVSTNQRIDKNTFYLDEPTGDLYYTDLAPWDAPYYELTPEGAFIRVEVNYV